MGAGVGGDVLVSFVNVARRASRATVRLAEELATLAGFDLVVDVVGYASAAAARARSCTSKGAKSACVRGPRSSLPSFVCSLRSAHFHPDSESPGAPTLIERTPIFALARFA